MLQQNLDSICSYLEDGYIFHKRMATETRKLGYRGWGRWHDCESKKDACSLLKLEKTIIDKLNYEPKYNVSKHETIHNMSLNSAADFKDSHVKWVEWEKSIYQALNEAIEKARTQDVEIYRELMCILDMIQREVTRVQLVMRRLDQTGWNGHDVGILSMVIHKWFEENPNEPEANFNIG